MHLLKKNWKKLGCIFHPNKMASWWHSHAMAPAPIQISAEIIRVYLGCWDKNGISRIGYIDVSANNPLELLAKSQLPILDLGDAGTFDENGVFPGHIFALNNQFYLYYTGFQLGQKIPHYNFGGLAISDDGINFNRVSKAPLLDRSDEGLSVRAGQSVLQENALFHSCYSAGTNWLSIGGKSRPIYDVYYQVSDNPTAYQRLGKKIIACNELTEHGLGRPQIYRINDQYIICYTRRTLNMKYHLGCALSSDLITWQRHDDWIGIPHGIKGSFDDEMVYFPALIKTTNNKVFLFYSGNNFGEGGLGVAELT